MAMGISDIILSNYGAEWVHMFFTKSSAGRKKALRGPYFEDPCFKALQWRWETKLANTLWTYEMIRMKSLNFSFLEFNSQEVGDSDKIEYFLSLQLLEHKLLAKTSNAIDQACPSHGMQSFAMRSARKFLNQMLN